MKMQGCIQAKEGQGREEKEKKVREDSVNDHIYLKRQTVHKYEEKMNLAQVRILQRLKEQ